MEIKKYIEENEQRFIDELFSLIRIPSISAGMRRKMETTPHRSRCRRSHNHAFTRQPTGICRKESQSGCAYRIDIFSL